MRPFAAKLAYPMYMLRRAEPTSQQASAAVASGFTLVELLIVIGIIALLIGLLMPALSKTRQIAQRTSCAAKLHEQLLGAQIHAVDHGGYYPLAGVLPGTQLLPAGAQAGIEPQNLEDPNATRYTYLSYPFGGFARMIAPITISLASEMSYKSVLNVQSNDGIGIAETDDGGFIRNFICPSQATSVSDFIQLPMLYYFYPDQGGEIVWYTEAMSYIYNEAALGWGDEDPSNNYNDTMNRAHGQVAKIRQPGRTMFVADGLGGNIYNFNRFPYPTGEPMATVYNSVASPPITLNDAYVGEGNPSTDKAGDSENFDIHRHNGKINIGFCDGHVETLSISPSDLSTVFLMAP
jgi:prepilin-type processing-associated H-X9-DG protein/prepilin-type N-terminal cleavage/methylation domain-containing protein